ncbi:hypothetical protein SCP_1000750 [Sparassis crispa]|uniref:Uncharacterized protein n=1 Tax=Sparassis crispa TaxID=139825 RepID=A0A401GXB8_9APHY|nr:hypothetical protein SCP_1000750 [Sparassis crispa]GBE86833.1 hypothetical protein SCP_1000750 [Sparassis crispa]
MDGLPTARGLQLLAHCLTITSTQTTAYIDDYLHEHAQDGEVATRFPSDLQLLRFEKVLLKMDPCWTKEDRRSVDRYRCVVGHLVNPGSEQKPCLDRPRACS